MVTTGDQKKKIEKKEEEEDGRRRRNESSIDPVVWWYVFIIMATSFRYIDTCLYGWERHTVLLLIDTRHSLRERVTIVLYFNVQQP